MKKCLIIGIAWMLAFSLLVTVASAQMPSLPYLPWGTVTIDGIPAPDSSLIQAYVDGELVAEMKGGTLGGHYTLAIPGEAIDGEEVAIKVNTIHADQTLVWKSGVSEQVNLTVTEGIYCGDDICQDYEDCSCSDCQGTSQCPSTLPTGPSAINPGPFKLMIDTLSALLSFLLGG